MLETLTRGFTSARKRLAGVRTLDEKNIQEALAHVRRALLEADLDLQQAEDFLARVREKALGKEVATRAQGKDGKKLRVDPGGHFTAICERELCALMESGNGDAEALSDAGLGSVMLVGLQGVGKTTLAAKLAYRQVQAGKRVLLAAADVQRPAAAEQLEALGASIGAPVLRGAAGESAVEICARAAKQRLDEGFDAVIYDTAGRTAIDDAMLAELAAIDAAARPESRLLVCDAMMGRDAVHTAQRFAAHIDLDGLVMSKADSDARGGAILAMKAATGVPIRFLSTGEGVKQLEAFRPEGIASRILGMGDVVGLVQDLEGALDAEQAEQDAERMLKGRFTMEDLLSQLRTLRKMGPLKELMARLPGGDALAQQADEGELGRVEALIQSMTRSERQSPELIDKSRAARIAGGSGRSVGEVNGLLDRFRQMKRMMGKLGKMGGKGGMPALPGGAGAGGFGAGGMGMDGLLGGFPGAGGLPGAGGGRQSRRAEAAQRKRANKKRKDAKKARRRGRRK